MIQVCITYTGKGYSPKDQWRTINHDIESFATIEEAKTFLKKRYGKCKRVPMYRDTKDGTKQTGWVYCYRNADWSHTPVEKWLSQDWCELRECKTLNVAA